VVVFNYQYTSGAAGGPRPAVVVSGHRYQRSKADVVIVPLTSRMPRPYVGDYDLIDWASAGLPLASRAKGVIDTIERSMIQRVVGVLTPRDLDGIKRAMRTILEL